MSRISYLLPILISSSRVSIKYDIAMSLGVYPSLSPDVALFLLLLTLKHYATLFHPPVVGMTTIGDKDQLKPLSSFESKVSTCMLIFPHSFIYLMTFIRLRRRSR